MQFLSAAAFPYMNSLSFIFPNAIEIFHCRFSEFQILKAFGFFFHMAAIQRIENLQQRVK